VHEETRIVQDDHGKKPILGLECASTSLANGNLRDVPIQISFAKILNLAQNVLNSMDKEVRCLAPDTRLVLDLVRANTDTRARNCGEAPRACGGSDT